MIRLERLRRKMALAGIDLVALAPGAHMRWLLGFAPHPDERLCLLLIGSDQAGFVMPTLNAEDARQHTDLLFWEWKDEDGPDNALNAALKHIGPKPRWVSLDETMRADHALHLLEALPKAKRDFTARTLVPLRMTKDPDELAILQENARIADAAQIALRDAIGVGISERALSDIGKAAFIEHGAQPSFSIVGTGTHSAFPHHKTSERLVQSGDIVLVDIGGSKGGYVSDITRMACAGAPPEAYMRVHDVVDAAVNAALATVRPGATAQSVDAAAREVIVAAGYGDAFTHRTGHGLGSEGHEPPYITATSEVILEENMVFTIEPGIYLPGQFGCRLEEVVVVTKDGCRVLSQLPRSLYLA